MILSAHQPAYLPWLGYFHKIALADQFIILDHVQYEKNSFINRNKIKSANGPIWLTIPVKNKAHLNKSIAEMEIDNQINWQDKHWKAIYYNYKKAPFFRKYCDFFEDLYKRDWIKLSDIINCQLEYLLKEIRIETKINNQSAFNIVGSKQELIINICHKFHAKEFIFGELGKDYADSDYFKSKGINIYFQNYHCPVYSQLWGDFVPNLSIIDLLFNVDPKNLLDIIMMNNQSVGDLKINKF